MAINTNSSDVAKRELEKMENPVKVLLFTTLDAEGLRHCPACQDAAQFVKELASMSDGKFEVEEYSISENHDICEQYHVDRVPTIIFPDFGIRYTGAPIGMEAAPFLQTIVIASTG
ncbi:MAG TPA: thioredoxin domain-containing protein, partial [Candidatus Lokiarchaeia archaeon]|nr:thioredoxin domain-containing protein [Candidatus Lokiarchaeia archaeon]